MALKAQKDKPSRKHRASKSGLTKTDGGIDGLHQSAASFGAATCYVDDGGVRRQVTDQSLSRILAVMGVQVETPEEVRLSLRESRSGRWRELVDRVMVVRVDRLPNTFAVRLPVDLDELRRPSLVSARSVALRYSGNRAHCSRTPPYPLFIHPSSLEALNIPARITRHECRMSGVFSLQFQCASAAGWSVQIPTPAGVRTMRVILLSAAVVCILTGVGSHRATSDGGLFQHPSRHVTLR